ncbi:hypothetical protein ABK040_010904 [Willaertia magna]
MGLQRGLLNDFFTFISGIPSYNVSLTNNNLPLTYDPPIHTSTKPLKEIPNRVLYIDANSIIHSKFNQHVPLNKDINNPSNFFQPKHLDKLIKQVKEEITKTLNKIITTYLPLNKVIIAFDGPCAFAKSEEQRRRRYNNIYSCLISPGTYIMFRLSEHVSHYCRTLLFQNKHLEIIFTDSFVAGEGELKILKLINELDLIYNGNVTHIVSTVDSDVNLLVFSTRVEKIFVMNINDFNCSLDKQYALKCLRNRFNKFTDLYNDIILDIIFITMSFGNDYLQSLPHEMSLLKLLQRYKKKREKYTSEKLIIIDNNNTKCIKLNLNFLLKILSKKSNLNKLKNLAKEDGYSKDVTKNYLDILLWCMLMYTNGNCLDYKLTCQFLPPMTLNQFIIDIFTLIKEDLNNEPYLILDYNDNTNNNNSLLPISFLLSILPFHIFKYNISNEWLEKVNLKKELIQKLNQTKLDEQIFNLLKELELQNNFTELKNKNREILTNTKNHLDIWLDRLLERSEPFIISYERFEKKYTRIQKIYKRLNKKQLTTN